MNGILYAFGRLVCKWRGHKWGRAYPGNPMVRPDETTWWKTCRRCGEVHGVKRRKPKEEKA